MIQSANEGHLDEIHNIDKDLIYEFNNIHKSIDTNDCIKFIEKDDLLSST